MYKKIAAGGLLSLGIAAFAPAQPLPAAGAPDKASSAPAWLYSVRPGDTLISLGQRHLVDPQRWDVVQRLNRIADPHRIPPGTVLRIPPPCCAAVPARPP
jgi:nucleoid-associated protein YgaU